jgi:hypothetical protein
MNVRKPNRTRIADSDRYEMQQKQSGDQHILPLDDSGEDPHRPHRTSRENQAVQAGSGSSRKTEGGTQQ